MSNSTLQVKAKIQVAKSASEIFEAIVNPAKMSNYFIASGSSRMEAGARLDWRFPEFDMVIPVRVSKVEKDKYISYYWDSEGQDTLVEINLEPAKTGMGTVVTVTEKERANDDKGIKWLQGNTEGWANFLACLKAYLDYGINLRVGAYDFMRK